MSAGILYAYLNFVRSSSTIIEGTSIAAHLTTSALYGSSASLKPGVEAIGMASPVLPSTPRIGKTPSILGDTVGDASSPPNLVAPPSNTTRHFNKNKVFRKEFYITLGPHRRQEQKSRRR
ncbi:hypothetical protein Adt_31912 [Abeliophyllum distichum]|uniref:Uncharacterized protein n=1 Tax=Abeliophyllum distichum TaxID=126358 RepID=A0ABD1RGB3_9LAMI